VSEKLKLKGKLVAIVLLIVFLDQISKVFAQRQFLTFCNKGIAFGVGLPDPFGILLSVAILSFIFYLMTREKKALPAFSMALIFGGGVSNLTDRFVYGCVRDFIDLKIWPSFNLADAAITFGVLLLIFSLFKNLAKNGLNT